MTAKDSLWSVRLKSGDMVDARFAIPTLSMLKQLVSKYPKTAVAYKHFVDTGNPDALSLEDRKNFKQLRPHEDQGIPDSNDTLVMANALRVEGPDSIPAIIDPFDRTHPGTVACLNELEASMLGNLRTLVTGFHIDNLDKRSRRSNPFGSQGL